MTRICIRLRFLPLLIGWLFIGTSCSAPAARPTPVPEHVSIDSAARRAQILVGGGQIDVILPEKTISAPDEAIVHWIKNAADSVTNYFGHYPVEQVTITLNP